MRESRVGAGDQVLSGGVGGGGEGVATVGSPDHLCLSVRAGPGTNPAAAGQQIPGQPGKCHAHQLAAIFSSHFLIYCQKNTPLCQKSNIFISLSLESLIVCADGRMTCPSFFSPPPPPPVGSLPPDFMRNLMQQISQYATAVATSATSAATASTTAAGPPAPPQPTPPGNGSSTATTGPNTPTTTPTAPPPPPNGGPPHARVVFTRPSFSPNIPPSAFGTRGTTINVRATMPGQQPGQVRGSTRRSPPPHHHG